MEVSLALYSAKILLLGFLTQFRSEEFGFVWGIFLGGGLIFQQKDGEEEIGC